MNEIGLRDLAQIVADEELVGEEFFNREHWEFRLLAAYRSPTAQGFLAIGGKSVLTVDVPKNTLMRINHERSSPPALEVRFPMNPRDSQHFLYEPDLVSYTAEHHPARLWLPTTYISTQVSGQDHARLCYVFSGPE